MKNLVLTKSGAIKLNNGVWELSAKDFDSSLSFLPGEWVIFYNEKFQTSYTGFINTFRENKSIIAWVVCSESIESPNEFIIKRIHESINKRRILGLTESRVVYSQADQLPGLIVDEYNNMVLAQIHSAGLDSYRALIKSTLEEGLNKPVYFFDKEETRIREGLPVYDRVSQDDDLIINESGIKFQINSSRIQKNGYYYDHRENRLKIREIIQRYMGSKESGLDLFCYQGSWGLSLLKAGVQKVDFVDQGNFKGDIENNLLQNNFEGLGEFYREDCFKYLKNDEKSYDVIVSDPPAFAKSRLKKKAAIDGYTRLHKMVLKKMNKQGIVAFGSCTHYVNAKEFEQSILEAARREKRSIQLLYQGLQGWDHPIRKLDDQWNYIKCMIYYVE